MRGCRDSSDTEIDLVALSESAKVVRLGTCERSAQRVARGLAAFDGHVARFLASHRRFEGWRVEKLALTTQHTAQTRRAVEPRGYFAQDLVDPTREP